MKICMEKGTLFSIEEKQKKSLEGKKKEAWKVKLLI